MKRLYLKIRQPRLERVLQFFVYFCTWVAGLVAFLSLPTLLIDLVGRPMVYTFGLFGFAGSVVSMFAILPGVVWLERVGIILLLTTVVMYIVMLVYAQGVPIAMCFSGALMLSLIQRLIAIREGALIHDHHD